MKTRILIAITVILLSVTGCRFSPDHHEGNNTRWILEQVEKGYLTEEEAYILLQQEKE